MEFKDYLKQVRTKKGLSMNQLAQRAEISAMYISELESGKRKNPSINVLRKLAKALDEPYLILLDKCGYLSA